MERLPAEGAMSLCKRIHNLYGSRNHIKLEQLIQIVMLDLSDRSSLSNDINFTEVYFYTTLFSLEISLWSPVRMISISTDNKTTGRYEVILAVMRLFLL